MSLSNEEIKAKLNLETGKLAWSELEPFFAKGIVICVDKKQDLIEAAALLAEDQALKITELLENKKIKKPGNEQARSWHQNRQILRAVVVAPWILIQEADAETG